MTSAPTSSTVTVIGGGRMGSGIAHVAAVAGHRVVIVESGASAAEAAQRRVRAGIQRAAEREALTEAAEQVLSRVRTTESLDDVPNESHFLIEAVPEDLELKREVLVRAEWLVAPSCVIATNTSSLPVGDLATSLQDPGRFLGLHFFNPVPASTLVEIVAGVHSTDEVVARSVELVTGLGKQHIVVRDSPGFATSRLGVLLGFEAIRMLEEGVADAASIDRAMELGYRHPMGPLRSTDLVGLDVRLAIGEHLAATLGERFTPPRLLREMVARGEFGRKSGQGFYHWE